MIPHDRESLFTRAIWAAARLRETQPDSAALRSIERQLFYLVGVARGTLPTEHLGEITLGALITREMRGGNDTFAALLRSCVAEVDAMQRETATGIRA